MANAERRMTSGECKLLLFRLHTSLIALLGIQKTPLQFALRNCHIALSQFIPHNSSFPFAIRPS